MTREVRPEQGLYVAVTAKGFVANGGSSGSSGPKLYIHEGTAVRKAGPGGTVFRLKLTEYGMVVERVVGPRVSVNQSASPDACRLCGFSVGHASNCYVICTPT